MLRNSVQSSWVRQLGKQAYQILSTCLFLQYPQALLHHTVLSLAHRLRSVSVGHPCGYLDVQRVQHCLVPPVLLPMRTSSSECTSVGVPKYSNHCSNKRFAVCSPSIHLLLGNAPVKQLNHRLQQDSCHNSKPRQTVNEIHVQQRFEV